MTDTRATILGVEDEPEIRRFLRSALGAEGYKVVEAGSVKRGTIDAASHKPDLAIVDLGLPDGEGLELIRRVRAWSPMPLIVLSARAGEAGKIAALDAGANDYVIKPFGIGELLARVRAALRGTVRPATGGHQLRLGGTVIDLDARGASRDGFPLHLTPTEYRFLTCLARNPGLVVTQGQLLREVWGPNHEADTHYLRIYAKQLRDKLEPDPLQPRYLLTETGVGYRLVCD
jgi:two-component system KDP operon response regulator KdpE